MGNSQKWIFISMQILVKSVLELSTDSIKLERTYNTLDKTTVICDKIKLSKKNEKLEINEELSRTKIYDFPWDCLKFACYM